MYNSSLNLMKGRLGLYDADGPSAAPEGQASRLQQAGGNAQQQRMIRDKRRSLDKAILYSYQGAKVKDLGNTKTEGAPALINPNKLKQDYDDKIVSIGYEYGFTPGTVFEWLGTGTYWLVYLQDLTELAYFRGDIRKCSYQVAWEEDGELYITHIAVRGPVETKINFIQKGGISVDTPNHSLNILMPKNEHTVKYFQRYAKFYLQDIDTCWRVEATDSISTPGILEVVAVEYYANETEDDINNGLVGGLIEKVEDPNLNNEIVGETFIKVKKYYEFSSTIEGVWMVDNKYPVIIEIDKLDRKKIKLKWDSPYSGQFDLYCGDLKKTIVVESLF